MFQLDSFPLQSPPQPIRTQPNTDLQFFASLEDTFLQRLDLIARQIQNAQLNQWSEFGRRENWIQRIAKQIVGQFQNAQCALQ